MSEKKIIIVGISNLENVVINQGNPGSRQWCPFQIEIWDDQIAIVAVPENHVSPLVPLQEIETLANLLARENIAHETQKRNVEGEEKIDCIRLRLPLRQRENSREKTLPQRHPIF